MPNKNATATRAWTINASTMTSIAGGSVLEAGGNVELRMGDDYMLADFARYYPKTHWVYLSGHVRVSMGKDLLTAESAEFNLTESTGWLTNGIIFLEGSHTYVEGVKITRHAADLYTFHNATITMCDADTPAWSMSSDSAVVELDGYAELWGVSFRVLDAPVLYSPFMTLPTKTGRQTGLLRPEFGNSTAKGFTFNQPFFWAIDDSRDLTFNAYYMAERGVMGGATYRSKASEDENLWLRMDYLHDKIQVNQDSGSEYSGDGLIRTNSSRWWLRGMTDLRLPETFDPSWQLRASVDFVSDQDYLKQFESSLSGFNQTRTDLFNGFSRDLRERDHNRESGVMLFREWTRASLYLTGTYTQNTALGHGNRSLDSDDTVQTLPELSAFWHKGRLFDSLPLEFEGSLIGGYKYRHLGDKGFRTEFVPRVSLPLNSEYGSLIASADLRSSFYNTNVYTQPGLANFTEREHNSSNFAADFDLAASSEIFIVYALGSEIRNGQSIATPASDRAGSNALPKPGDSDWLSIKHSVIPRLDYHRRTDYSFQKRNPSYDEYDRAKEANALVYSLENSFVRKRATVETREKPGAALTSAERTTDGETPPAKAEQELYYKTDYLQFLRLKLEQTYDFEESGRERDLEAYPRRPFRDLIAEAAFYLDETVSLNTKAYWSAYSHDITRWDQGVNLNIQNLGSFYTGLSFRDKAHDYYTQRDKLSMLSF
ncbi:MAG: LPS assembly protein LptD, partial [Deltaproteobacteria bacterium]|nr:LPS assembly protein LptD [Deltaproteobacteria bacterium]